MQSQGLTATARRCENFPELASDSGFVREVRSQLQKSEGDSRNMRPMVPLRCGAPSYNHCLGLWFCMNVIGLLDPVALLNPVTPIMRSSEV